MEIHSSLSDHPNHFLNDFVHVGSLLNKDGGSEKKIKRRLTNFLQ